LLNKISILATSFETNRNKKRKTCRNISAGPFVFIPENKKAKGEEKPEEELMGKCKSSPSFETAKQF